MAYPSRGIPAPQVLETTYMGGFKHDNIKDINMHGLFEFLKPNAVNKSQGRTKQQRELYAHVAKWLCNICTQCPG